MDTTSTADASSGSVTGDSCITRRFGENTNDHVNGVTADTFVVEAAPIQTNGSNSELVVDGNVSGRLVTLLRFELSSITASSTIESAMLYVGTNGTSGSESTPGSQFSVYAVLEAWSEADATWVEPMPATAWSTPGCAGPPCLDDLLGFFEPIAQNTIYQVAISPEIVVGWIADRTTNHGLAIATDAVNGADFHASESADATMRPSIEITYCER